MKAREWQKTRAVSLIAAGWTHAQAAGFLKLSVTTIGHWVAQDPEFRERLANERARVLERMRETIIGNVVAASEMQRDVLSGELPYDSDEWKEGSRLLYTALKGGLGGLLEQPQTPQGPPRIEAAPPRILED